VVQAVGTVSAANMRLRRKGLIAAYQDGCPLTGRPSDRGVKEVRDLRHNFAAFGAGGGMGLPIIGKLLGHTQPQTTARYAHLDADPLRCGHDRREHCCRDG